MKIPLLDHGFIRLVSYTQPVPDTIVCAGEGQFNCTNPGWNGDLEAIRNARVSYNADFRTGDDAGKDQRLIERMLLNAHTSPFEAMHFTFEVQAPIFVFRQWHRHRTWGYNEVSARYTELPDLFYVPDANLITGQHETDKQMRSDEPLLDAELVRMYMTKSNSDCFALYKTLLARGVARELARTVLPFATYSRMFGTVSLGNLLKFLILRQDEHAQYEIRVYADAMRQLVQPLCPWTIQTFDTHRKVQKFVQQCIERARKDANEPLDATMVFDAFLDTLAESPALVTGEVVA